MVMAAFAEGCGGQMVPPVALLDGDAAMYGILRGTGEIYKKAIRAGRETYYLDHGYVGFSHQGGYYRIARNGRQSVIDPEHDWPSDRFETLGVELKPWRKDGKSILVIPLTDAIAGFYGLDANKWLGGTVSELTRHTDRPILTKPKGEGEILRALQDVWCVVTHSSNVAVDSLLQGVPVVALGESIAQPLSWSYADIEKPHWPEREKWAHGVAWQQWTLQEMRRGEYAAYAGIERRRAA
jgi:hypothetical protein